MDWLWCVAGLSAVSVMIVSWRLSPVAAEAEWGVDWRRPSLNRSRPSLSEQVCRFTLSTSQGGRGRNSHTHTYTGNTPLFLHTFISLSCCVHKLLFLSFAVFFSKNISKNIVFQGWVLFMLYAKSIDLIYTTPTHKRRYLRASLCAHTFPCLFMTLHSVDYVDTLRFKPTTDVLISSWFFLDTPSSCWPVGWICSMTLPDEALMCGCECVSVFRSRICVWEWWRRRTICLAECGCAWYLGVAALQMFWLFLALLCFRFPLVCLEVEGLQAVHCGTFDEVWVKDLRCAPL